MNRFLTENKVYITLFLISLVVRISALLLYPLDYFGWYTDSYHRWQIAIYTLKIGLSHGRLWDLLGMEYFWGILPILLEVFFLWVFNTLSLIPFRTFNMVIGSLNVIIFYLVTKKYLKTNAFITALLISLCPVVIFVDISGMAEPLAFLFLFSALLFYNERDYLFGVLLGLASMCRIEFWPISWGLLACYLIFERSTTKFVPALVGWLTPMVPYFWHLGTWTGDIIYPLRWYLVGDIVGQWMGPRQHPLTSLWRGLFIAVLISSVTGLLYILKRKPKNYLIYAFIFGNLLLHGISFGISAYSAGFIPIYFIDRLIVMEYIFLAMAVPLFIKWVKKTSIKTVRFPIRWILGSTLIMLVAFLYVSVALYSYQFNVIANEKNAWRFSVGDWVSAHYEGGTIISDDVVVNYRLVNDKIQPQRILGSIYAPHGNLTATCLWLMKENVTMIIYLGRVDTLFPNPAAILEHPAFYYIGDAYGAPVFGVNQTSLSGMFKFTGG